MDLVCTCRGRGWLHTRAQFFSPLFSRLLFLTAQYPPPLFQICQILIFIPYSGDLQRPLISISLTRLLLASAYSG